MSRFHGWRDYVTVTAIASAEGVAGVLVPVLLDGAGFAVVAIGPLVAIGGIASLVSRFPSGAAYRPTRARWLMTGSLLVALVCSLLYPIAVTSTAFFVVVRTVWGLATGMASTINLAYFIDSRPPGAARARAMGMYGGGMAAGFMIGNGGGGVAADLFGFQGAFLISALFWLLALALSLLAPVPRGAAPRPVAAPVAGARPVPARSLPALLSALRDPGVAGVVGVAFSLNALHQVGNTFFPVLARGAGIGLAEIGLVRGIYSLVGAIARPLSTPFIERMGPGRASFGAFVLQSGFVAAVPLGTLGGFPAFLGIFSLSGGARAVGTVANAVALAEDIPESRLNRGLAAGLYNASKDLGNIAGPLLGSALTPLIGFEAMFAAAPVLLLVVYTAIVLSTRQKGGVDSVAA